MDYELDGDQRALLKSVGSILERLGGAPRAREVGSTIDRELNAALKNAGLFELANDPDAGPLMAALVVEAVAKGAGSVDIGARALVAPALLNGEIPDVVALADARSAAPVRYGAEADAVLVLDGHLARLVAPKVIEEVASPFGPFARLDLSGGTDLGEGSGARLRCWWQTAIAAEVAGAAAAAVELTSTYLQQRIAFGQPLATKQVLQHRLAELHVSVQSVSWLARVAAWSGAEPTAAATAAAQAAVVARSVGVDTLQLSGAIGFTTEYDLHVWVGRLHAARAQLGGANSHAEDAARARWLAPA